MYSEDMLWLLRRLEVRTAEHSRWELPAQITKEARLLNSMAADCLAELSVENMPVTSCSLMCVYEHKMHTFYCGYGEKNKKDAYSFNEGTYGVCSQIIVCMYVYYA